MAIHFLSCVQVPVTIARRFISENMLDISASLAFTTLLALVPLATVVVSLLSTLPYSEVFIQRLDALLVESLLPVGSAGIIADHIGRFCAKARALTVPGIAMLAVTTILLLHNIEQTFNHVWQVKPRPYLQRLGLYAFVTIVFPLLLGIVAFLSTTAVTTSLGFFKDTGWMRGPLQQISSFAMLWLFFSFLYYAVPNARVARTAALTGGFFAALMIALMQKGFEVYLANIGTYKSIYGAFSAVPIFLIWLYLSWALILVGGLIAATAFSRSRR